MMRRLVFLVFTLALASAPARAESRCISDWSEAAPIVRSEGLYTVEKLTAEARGNIKGTIIKTTLCKDDATWVFRLIVRVKGNLKMMTVDAKNPFPR
jgi:uncharacterized membrane protein YkoI